MKNLCISLAVIASLVFVSQEAFAACNCVQPLNSAPSIIYMETTPYVVEPQKARFSLNPFTGFKNCNKCKMKKVKKCDECTRLWVNPCPTCRKAFAEPCPSCEKIYIQPVLPKCTSCGR